MRMVRYLPLVLLALMCCARPAKASCGVITPYTNGSISGTAYVAATANYSDVSSCAATEQAAKACNDLLVIPAGSASWGTSQLSLSPKTGCASLVPSLTLQGATVCNGTPGVQITSCTDNTNITIGKDEGIIFTGCNSTAFCVFTGITITAGTAPSHALLEMDGTFGQQSFRAHHFHIKNTSISGGVATAFNDGYGLVDHYLFDETSTTPMTPVNVGGDFPSHGYRNWQDTSGFGTANSIFVEDSLSNQVKAGSEGFYDGYFGCRITIRYTTINGNQIGGGHGTDSGGYRGCVMGEFYHLTVSNSTGTAELLFNTRSGAYMVHDTTIGGTTAYSGIDLQYYRISECINAEAQLWGCAVLTSPGINWTPYNSVITNDQAAYNVANAPNWAASHSYAAGAIISPTSGNAGNGSPYGGYVFYTVSGGTSGGSAPTWTQTVGNTVTDGTVTWKNLGGGGAASLSSGCGFDPSNPDNTGSTSGYSRCFDANGGTYPYRDQPGRAGQQVLLGNWQWNNSHTGSQTSAGYTLHTDPATSTIIVSGTDYTNGSAPPGYTPYTYPHPLQGAVARPPIPPLNLTIIASLSGFDGSVHLAQ